MSLLPLMNNNHKLADNQEQYNLLRDLEKRFQGELGLSPCVGVELEFYLANIPDISLLEQKLGHKIKEEKGQNQYELDLPPSQELVLYAKYVDEMRQKTIDAAKTLGGDADFTSKPFAGDYGSAMHVHLNFLEDDDVEKYAKILCHYLPETINAFLPKKEDYLRLDSQFMAPTHISYGGNNRTVLIRIPDTKPRRLEHRLAAADAKLVHILCTMLISIEKGLKYPELVNDLQKTFGNAFDPQYGLRKICSQ
jgi:glutamine synthetase